MGAVTDDSPTGSDLSGSGCQQPNGAGAKSTLRSSMRASAHAGAGISEICLEGSSSAMARRQNESRQDSQILVQNPDLWKFVFRVSCGSFDPDAFRPHRSLSWLLGKAEVSRRAKAVFLSFVRAISGPARSYPTPPSVRRFAVAITTDKFLDLRVPICCARTSARIEGCAPLGPHLPPCVPL